MKRAPISRRTLLKAGAVAVGLPLLEAMAPRRARADAALPRRFVLVVAGHSLGPDFKGAQLGDLKAMPSMAGETVAADVGPGYTLPVGWQPLGRVRAHVCAVSGLRIPAGFGVGVFHNHGSLFQLSGTIAKDQFIPSITADHLMARTLAAPGMAFPSLQVTSDLPVKPLSHGYAGGQLAPVTPIASPHQLFQSLFGNFAGGATPAERAQLELLQRKNASVLDLVLKQSAALRARLGAADQGRLDGHLESVRALERRLQQSPPMPSSTCKAPPDPGVNDPLVIDWSARARIFADLAHMAVACDLTRVVMWQLSESTGAGLTLPMSSGELLNIHDAGHGQQRRPPGVSYMRDMALVQRWHLEQFTALVERFLATPEGSGTLLDNTVIVYLSDLGYGLEYQGNPPVWSSHGNQQRQVMYATGLPGLKVGTHIATQEADPSSVLLTLMRALGHRFDLGAVTSELPELKRV